MGNSSIIVKTTVACAGSAVLGHGLLWLAYSMQWTGVPWQPVVGISLVLVATSAFGGFYVASRRARIAIAASFLLTFIVMVTFVLTISPLASVIETGSAKDLLGDFRQVVTIIVGFYFGAEAAVGVAKVISASKPGADATDVQRADRDLVEPAAPS